jgi:hypothetical protein
MPSCHWATDGKACVSIRSLGKHSYLSQARQAIQASMHLSNPLFDHLVTIAAAPVSVNAITQDSRLHHLRLQVRKTSTEFQGTC